MSTAIQIRTVDNRPHVPLTIFWKNGSQTQTQALVDTGAEVSIIYGNPKKFKGIPITISRLGGNEIQAKQVTLTMKIGNLPKKDYKVVIVSVPENILGIDILKGMSLTLPDGNYHFAIRTFKVASVIVGKLLQPLVSLPDPTRIVTCKQYRIPGGQEEITATIKEYENAGVLVTTTSQWNSPIWPVKKSDGLWRMTVDYRELNKVTPPLTAAVPDTIALVEKVQAHPGTWYAVIDLANAFFTIPIEQQFWDQFAFTWQGRQYAFTRLPQGYKHSPTICHRIVAEHLDEYIPDSSSQIVHYIDDILIQSDSEDKVREHLEQVITLLKKKGWEINSKKIQGPAQCVQFLGILWEVGARGILPKGK